MRNRGVVALLGVSIIFLIVATVLARCGDDRMGPVTAAATAPVEFPRERAIRERRLQRQVAKASSSPPASPGQTSRDRLSRALSSPGKDGAVIFEVNALRHSPIVDALLRCRRQQGGDEIHGLDTLKSELGVDVTEDVDRVALDAEVLAVSGFFKELVLPEGIGSGDAHGDGGRVFTMEDSKGEPTYLATVGDDLLMTSSDPEQLKAAIDRAEGRAEAGSVFPDGVAGGEVYGLIGPALMGELLRLTGANDSIPGLKDMITTTQVRLAVDSAAAISLDIGTRTPEEGEQLAKALGAAVVVARAQAINAGRTELAGLLDQAKVVPGADGTIAFDVAIPGNELLVALGCPPLDAALPSNAVDDRPTP
jgi:hypothetical protein